MMNGTAMKAGLSDYKQKIRATERTAIQAVANEIRDLVRKRLPPGAIFNAGMPNTFPGYAATGQLKNLVVAGRVEERQFGRMRATVGLSPIAPAKARMRFIVHEFGRIIKAHGNGYLVFQVQGRWVKVKQVHIREKRFFRSAWDEAHARWPTLVYKHVYGKWPT